MGFYDDVLRAERQRTLGCGIDIEESYEVQCPVCGSVEWEFLYKDCHGDTVGCQECVSKTYPDEWH